MQTASTVVKSISALIAHHDTVTQALMGWGTSGKGNATIHLRCDLVGAFIFMGGKHEIGWLKSRRVAVKSAACSDGLAALSQLEAEGSQKA